MHSSKATHDKQLELTCLLGGVAVGVWGLYWVRHSVAVVPASKDYN